ncbi:MAG: hypothetical protein RLZZ71_1646 [Bacteroidota bacterium]|jgi:hypothetical protein
MKKSVFYYTSITGSIVITNILLIAGNVIFPKVVTRGIDPWFSIFLGILLMPLVVLLIELTMKLKLSKLTCFLPVIIASILSLIAGAILQSTGLGTFFMMEPFVFVFGFIAVFTYFVLIKLESRIERLPKWFTQFGMALLPVVMLVLYLVIFPGVFPSKAFQFMPQEIQDEIIKETLSEIHVGDSFSKIDSALPGKFKVTDGYTRASRSGENMSYELIIKNNTVVYIELELKK